MVHKNRHFLLFRPIKHGLHFLEGVRYHPAYLVSCISDGSDLYAYFWLVNEEVCIVYAALPLFPECIYSKMDCGWG